MSDAVLQTIELIKAEIKTLENLLNEKRRMANGLCAMIGQPALRASIRTSAKDSRREASTKTSAARRYACALLRKPSKWMRSAHAVAAARA